MVVWIVNFEQEHLLKRAEKVANCPWAYASSDISDLIHELMAEIAICSCDEQSQIESNIGQRPIGQPWPLDAGTIDGNQPTMDNEHERSRDNGDPPSSD